MKNIKEKISDEMYSRLGEKLYENNTTKLNWSIKLLMLELELASTIKHNLSILLLENVKL